MLTTVVFDDLRLAYVPVPKAASTTILRALSELAGVRPEDLVRSRKLEVTRALTVHDGSLWPSAHRLTGRDAAELEWILWSDDWFRFTVVREPARRIWSAWVSKVLVRNPRFFLMHGEELFPALPASAKDVVESFRRFVTCLPDRPEWSDSHWSSQSDLLDVADITYSHMGRVESIDRTVAEVGEYVRRRGSTLPSLEAENRSFLPFSPGLFDRESHDAYLHWTARDYEALGYAPLPYVEGEPDDRWYASVEASVPAIRALVEQNERFLDVWHQLDDAPEPRRDVRVLRAAAASPSRSAWHSRIAVRLLAAAIALLAVFVVLPEVFGDRPYDPRPSGWPAAIENQ
jgi:Sulfotransferase family